MAKRIRKVSKRRTHRRSFNRKTYKRNTIRQRERMRGGRFWGRVGNDMKFTIQAKYNERQRHVMNLGSMNDGENSKAQLSTFEDLYEQADSWNLPGVRSNTGPWRKGLPYRNAAWAFAIYKDSTYYYIPVPGEKVYSYLYRSFLLNNTLYILFKGNKGWLSGGKRVDETDAKEAGHLAEQGRTPATASQSYGNTSRTYSAEEIGRAARLQDTGATDRSTTHMRPQDILSYESPGISTRLQSHWSPPPNAAPRRPQPRSVEDTFDYTPLVDRRTGKLLRADADW